MTRTDWERAGHAEVADYERLGTEYADLAAQEMDLEAGRSVEKDHAVRRIMEQPNPLNGDKPHSATSAEKLVEGDAEYAAYLRRQRETVHLKNIAFTAMTGARLRAELAIAALRAGEGVPA